MATQTSYTSTFSPARAGTPGDTGPRRAESAQLNPSPTWTQLPLGIGMVYPSAGVADVPTASTQHLRGVLMDDQARRPDGLTGANAFLPGESAQILVEGSIKVTSEQTVDVGDKVYCRFAAGTGTQLGAFRKDSDNGTAMLVRGARWIHAGDATGSNDPAVYFDSAAQKVASTDPAGSAALTAAAQSGTSITVSGQITDANGNAVAATTEVFVQAIAATASQGALTAVTGTGHRTIAPSSTQVAEMWITTNSSGVFSVAVADTQAADSVLFVAVPAGGMPAAVKLSYS